MGYVHGYMPVHGDWRCGVGMATWDVVILLNIFTFFIFVIILLLFFVLFFFVFKGC